jgi:Flp pilus assembly protein TadD
MPVVDQENQSAFANGNAHAASSASAPTASKHQTMAARMMRSEAAMDGGVVLDEAQRQKDIDYYAELAETYLEQGKNEAGLEASRQWIALEPRDADPRNFVAQFLCNLERWSDAIVELRLALKLKPNDVDNLDLLGTALTNQQQFAEAKEVYEQLICLLDPGRLQTRESFRECEFKGERPREIRENSRERSREHR